MSASRHPNVEMHVQPLSLDAFGQPLHRYPTLTVSVCNLRPESRGSVMLEVSDPTRPFQIRPNYLSTAADVDIAVDSIRLARRLMATNRMAAYRPEEVSPGVAFNDDEQLAEAASQIGTTIFHPVGTAKMAQLLIQQPSSVRNSGFGTSTM